MTGTRHLDTTPTGQFVFEKSRPKKDWSSSAEGRSANEDLYVFIEVDIQQGVPKKRKLLKSLIVKIWMPYQKVARVQAQGKNSGPASNTRYFVLSAFAHERSILIGCLLLDSIIRSVIHHKGSQ
jgi:hypothetical protein